MKFLKAFVSMAVTALMIWALDCRFGTVPPIGAFMNPSTGFWQNAESKYILPAENLKISGLQDQVTIKFD